MDIKFFLEQVVKQLKQHKVRFALAGGVVASLYRSEQRTTKDIDFVLVAEKDTLELATQLIQKNFLQPHIIRKADLEGGPLFAIKRKSTKPYLVAGRAEKNNQQIGLDFILPEMPWVLPALERAEHHKIDFGFAKIPCLTVEDVIIAKIFALKNSSKRFNDLDDLQSIFLARHELDLAYLNGRLQAYELTVPKVLKDVVPDPLKKTAKFK